ncbi:MAG: hypothetical protein ACRCTA_04220 [Bacilli bacterium]
MNKIDYLVEAFNQRAYVNKSFLLSIFSKVSQEDNDKLLKIPYALLRDEENKKLYFYRGDEKVFIDANYDSILFDKNEIIKVTGGASNYVVDEVETTVGLFLVNVVVLKEALGNKIEYVNKSINGGFIRDLIDSLMVDNPKEDGLIPDNKASVDQCLKITKQLDYLEGLNPVFVKASSIDVLTVHPEVIKARDEGLKELEEKGLLEDEIAIATFINKLVAMDTAIQLNGPSKDLFIDMKFIDNARKKMFLIFDMIPNFHTGKYELLVKSLNEGWDFSKLDSHINTAVSAFYDRGVATGEGGAEVKVIIQLTGRIEIGSDDCGTTRTELVTFNKHNFKGWVKGYYLDNGKPVIIENKDKDKLIGKTVNMRVPQYCKEPNDNLCKVCCGENLGGIGHRVSAEVVLIFSILMLLKMKAMHVSSMKVVTIDIDLALR